MAATHDRTPTQLIDARIEELGDWRGDMLARVRALIKQADPDIVEEWKWAKATSPGTPVWSDHGDICTGETYKSVVKLTFFKGAQLKDPAGLFNSSLEGNARRAIDIHEGETLDSRAFKALIKAATRSERRFRPRSRGRGPPGCLVGDDRVKAGHRGLLEANIARTL